MKEYIKVGYSVRAGTCGSECDYVVEIEKSYWDSLTPEQKRNEMQEYAFQHVDWFYRVLD